MERTELEATLIQKVTSMQQDMERRETRLIALLQQRSERDRQLTVRLSSFQKQIDTLNERIKGLQSLFARLTKE